MLYKLINGLIDIDTSSIIQIKTNIHVSMVRSLYGDTPFFQITAGLLQGDNIVAFLFIICLDHVLRNSLNDIENIGLIITERKSRRYPEYTYNIYRIHL